jgi:hypothetical protein
MLGARVVLDRRATAFYKPRANRAPPSGPGAQVAQLVEHVTENHGVAGSIPALGTILFLYIFSTHDDANDIVIPISRDRCVRIVIRS